MWIKRLFVSRATVFKKKKNKNMFDRKTVFHYFVVVIFEM